MNRFDIVHAHYLHACWNHTGQGSALYAKACRIQTYYTPARSAEDRFENLDQVAIYEALEEKRLGRSIGYTECLCCVMPIMGMGLCDDCAAADCALDHSSCCNCEIACMLTRGTG